MTVAAVSSAALPARWLLGEHIAVVGDTGTGKTYLISQLVAARKYVVFFSTKRDETTKHFEGFQRARRADKMDDVFASHIILSPSYENQAREGWEMLERAWKQGNWTIVIDELWYAEKLGLKWQVERLLTQGRSKGVSVVVGMQRPAMISRFAIASCTHLFSFRLDGRDADTIKLATMPAVQDAISTLDHTRKDFAYFHRAKRIVAIGNARRMGEIMQIPRVGT